MTMPGAYHFPASSLGYWRGAIGITGPPAEGVRVMGVATEGVGMQSAGTVSVAGQQWHPTILYLFALLIGEMIAFHVIGRILK
jgi:hypothetical protein